MPRFKVGDVVYFENDDVSSKGTVREVTEREDYNVFYSVNWEDGFEDGEGNVFPEWSLDTFEEAKAKGYLDG